MALFRGSSSEGGGVSCFLFVPLRNRHVYCMHTPISYVIVCTSRCVCACLYSAALAVAFLSVSVTNMELCFRLARVSCNGFCRKFKRVLQQIQAVPVHAKTLTRAVLVYIRRESHLMDTFHSESELFYFLVWLCCCNLLI